MQAEMIENRTDKAERLSKQQYSLSVQPQKNRELIMFKMQL